MLTRKFQELTKVVIIRQSDLYKDIGCRRSTVTRWRGAQANEASNKARGRAREILIDTAVAKAHGNAYRPDYLRNHNKAFIFLPLLMSTSDRLHSEFARLLYILAHQRAVRFFATLHYEPCDEELSR